MQKKTDISQLKETLQSTEERLIEAYLTRIREIYCNLGWERRSYLIRHLGDLTRQLESGGINANIRSFPSINHYKESVLNIKRLRKIREGEDLSLADLAENLGAKNVNSAVTYICKLETGKDFPKSLKGELTLAYFLWLKERGYNPYSI